MTTWWLIVVLFGGTDIPCTQENPIFKSWHLKKKRSHLTAKGSHDLLAIASFQGRNAILSCFLQFYMFSSSFSSQPSSALGCQKLQTFYMEDSSVAFTVYFANLEYLAVDKTKRLKRVSSCGRAPEHCNREKSKSFVPEPSLLEDF